MCPSITNQKISEQDLFLFCEKLFTRWINKDLKSAFPLRESNENNTVLVILKSRDKKNVIIQESLRQTQQIKSKAFLSL